MSDNKQGTGIDRRGALECMIWAGTGIIWTLSGGVPKSAKLLGIGTAQAAEKAVTGFSFLQISDSHVGFNKPANPDALGTLKEAIGKVNGLLPQPTFMIHTGDITHLSKPGQFDDAEKVIGEAKLDVHYVPGEHDVIDEENGKAYLERYGKNTKGTGWYSFDAGGVHFIGLVNVANLKAGGMGSLGDEQLLGSRMISRASQPQHRSSSSRIYRFGPSMPIGAGARRIRPARSPCSNGSARSPSSTAISIN